MEGRGKEGWTDTARRLLLTLRSVNGFSGILVRGRLEIWGPRRTGDVALRVEIACEDCAGDCERAAAVDKEGTGQKLVGYPDSLGCTYTIPQDISRPIVIFLRKGSWRSLMNVMGKRASAKSQMALIAGYCLALGGW